MGVLLVEETRVPGEPHQHGTSHCQTIHIIPYLFLAMCGIITLNLNGDGNGVHMWLFDKAKYMY